MLHKFGILLLRRADFFFALMSLEDKDEELLSASCTDSMESRKHNSLDTNSFQGVSRARQCLAHPMQSKTLC